jgi:hypothetical protein
MSVGTGGCCGHDNEPSGSVNFFHKRRNCYLLKNAYAQWSYVRINPYIVCEFLTNLLVSVNAKRPVTEALQSDESRSRKQYLEGRCCVTMALPAQASNRF